MSNIPNSPLKSEVVYSLGADPEFFVYEGAKLLPAFHFLPSKHDNSHIFWDGFQAEFTYEHGHHRDCIGIMGSETKKNLREFHKLVKGHSRTARISLQNTVKVSDKFLESSLDPHVALGCSPSENAYKMKGLYVDNGRKLKYRFAGGHMHFGGFRKGFKRHEKIVKTLDKIVGIWGVGAAQNIDIPLRRVYYGLAGEYRPTRYPGNLPANDVYGLEYRTLSNFYYCHPAIHQLAWEIARFAVVLSESNYDDLWVADEAEVIKIINNCDVEAAQRILKRNEPLLRWGLESKLWNTTMIDLALKIGQEGVECAIRKPDSIASNWHVAGNAVNYDVWERVYGFRALACGKKAPDPARRPIANSPHSNYAGPSVEIE